jgi:NAD(P)-dependent dehydrogenase (short-subunit alcohol dehydrogenase family)
MEIQGKVSVVTGSGSGIGKAIALSLAGEGADVVLADINEAGMQEVSEEIAKLGRRTLSVKTDVAKLESIQNLFDQTLASMGQVDILVNNAGVHMSGPFNNVTLDDWKWMMDINVWSVIYGVHVFLPYFLKKGAGYIVNTASIAGQVGVLDAAVPYTTTKFAVVGFSESLALFLNKKNIGVTVICPGVVETNIGKGSRRIKADDGLDEARDKLYASFAQNPQSRPRRPFQVISAADVGNMAVAAIKENKFLVVTHDEDKKNIQKRADDIQRLIHRRADVIAEREAMIQKLLQTMK